ncbi:G-rich domain on putative tyrosine kinase [Maribacter aquivivus]|uniref:non-specific protein-tyrosine kinase n=1 Tax=Maribacter aquivivus TaxID=228958 RepID=A0A1M6LJH7_9FLAO|nr:Wzz/FepE/Etk N-terminal domain-containing protein [Maribacter aquivivus]SHJ71366.1 G-rich domain on putative tyrosine kinase [Maribacter aquivivus]
MTEKEYFDSQMSSKENGENFDLKALFAKYLKSWKLFLISLIVFLALAVAALQFVRTSYNVTSKILLKNETATIDASGNNLVNNNPFSNSEKVNNEIEVLTSVHLMRSVLDSLSLQGKVIAPDVFPETELYGSELPFKIVVDTLFPLAYETTLKIKIEGADSFSITEEFEDALTDSSTSSSSYGYNTYNYGYKIEKPYGIFHIVENEKTTSKDAEFVVEFRDIDELAHDYVKKVLNIYVVNKDASVINIELKESNPEKGEDIINGLVEMYGYKAFLEKNAVALENVKFIDNRLNTLSVELSEVEMNVAQFKTENELANVEFDANSFAAQEIDYGRKLTESEIELKVLSAIERNLKRGDSESTINSLSVTSANLIYLIDSYNKLLIDKKSLQRTVPENNPRMIDIRGQLEQLRRNILGSLSTSKQSLRTTINSIKGRSDQFVEKKQRIPNMQRQLLEISREQGIKENLFLYLLQKREEAALMVGVRNDNFTIIDRAITDFESGSPSKKSFLLISFLMGLIVPIGFIHLKDALNSKVTNKKDVEAKLNVPVIGEIVHNKSKNNLIEKGEEESALGQSFRMMRMNLDFMLSKKKVQTVLVTSAIKGEGKTFFSSNMGVALASSSAKVLILELDKHNPELIEALGETKKEYGISNYLNQNHNTITVNDLLIPVNNNPNLFAIGLGSENIDGLEFFNSNRMEILMNNLKQEFDYILIDSAPIGKLADTFALSRFTDCCICMVRENHSNLEDLAIIEDLKVNKKFKNPMVVLNDVTSNE